MRATTCSTCARTTLCAYQWLGGILSVPAKQAHIAQLSLLSCNLVIREAKKQVNWYHMRKMAALQQTQEGDVKAS